MTTTSWLVATGLWLALSQSVSGIRRRACLRVAYALENGAAS